MRARDVVGRRITGIRQQIVHSRGRTPAVEVIAIDLDNGRAIYFTINEHDCEYGVSAHVTRRRSEKA